MDYGDKEVLHDLNFVIPEHSLVSILGPSGCGKSTTLMLISGLTFPTKGKIFFNEKEVTKQDAVKRKVGMVFQNYALYPHLSVLENIMFPLKMAKMPKKQRKERALELAKLVQIEDHIHKKPKQLSGGQQQRVAIARALAKEPDILLMDEPLSNLDARLRIEMREEIRRIQQETNVTTIFVTHDQEEALSISDHVMVLNEGHIQQISEPQKLYEHPRNLFVAEFLGNPAINTFDVEDPRVEVSALDIPEAIQHQVKKVGIRPENIVQTMDSAKAFYTGEVTHVERIGKDTSIKLNQDGLAVVTTNIAGKFQIGETLHLTADTKDILYFDAAGQSLLMEEVAQ
nr:ABC transporter ATP-binding protein [Desemzia sp. RIT 804]